jgi:hypothetical protein
MTVLQCHKSQLQRTGILNQRITRYRGIAAFVKSQYTVVAPLLLLFLKQRPRIISTSFNHCQMFSSIRVVLCFHFFCSPSFLLQ